jgi:group II intron reverse transcriptase/maturase
LASAITVELLRKIHRKQNGKKATGVDRVSKEEYGRNLDANLENLIERMKRESYKPKPSRRVYIDKPGSAVKRPLGISCYEDKLVENAVAQLLEAVYEPKFSGASFGFRPKRNCHGAIREVIEDIQYRKTNYVVEADIKSFFDTLDHEWLVRFLEHDIADRKFIGIIRRFLKAGIMEEGKLLESEKGSPQGNGASPILANVYLHYVLDLWFELAVKKQCKGESYLIRYCDDFVCCFQHEDDAERFYHALPKRFAKFGLSLAPEKTKILEFGRFARENRARHGQGKPETFSFLGFTMYCSTDSRKGFFRVKARTDRKKMISKLKKLNLWLKAHRHWRVKEILAKINQSLRGHYHYYGVTDNTRNLERFRNTVKGLVFKWLNRRSQRCSYNWKEFNDKLLARFPILQPKVYVSLFYR